MASPAVAVAGAVFMIDRSARRPMVVVAEAALLLGLGSGVVLLAVAVLLMVAALTTDALTMAVIMIVADAPAASVPTSHVTMPAELVQPLEAETKARSSRYASLLRSDAASEGPRLVTANV